MNTEEVADAVIGLVGGYHKAAGSVCSEFFSDDLFNVKLADYGYNGQKVQCGVTNITGFNEIPSSTQNYGLLANTGTRALYVLNSEQENNDISEMIHILFDERTNLAEIFLESKLSHFSKDHSLINFHKALHSDGRFMNRLLFDSSEAQKELQKNVGNLAIVRPNILFSVNFEDNIEGKATVSSRSLENIGIDLQGMRVECAVYMPKIPRFVELCLKGKKNLPWPSKETIEALLNCGIYFTPSQEKDSFWELDLCELESCLIQEMKASARNTLDSLCGLSDVIAQLCNLKISTIQHVISHGTYWHLSGDCGCKTAGNNDDLIDHILDFLINCLSQQCLCNYFIPKINIFKKMSENECLKLSEVLRSMRQNNTFLGEVLMDSNMNQILQNLTKGRFVEEQQELLQKILANVKDTILSSFLNTVKVMQLSLFQKLNRSDDINFCIMEHENTLKMLLKRSRTNQIESDMCQRLVSDSLASVYFYKSRLHSNCASHRTMKSSENDRFLRKAEELLLHGRSYIPTRVKLANIYFMTERYSDCSKLTCEILTSISAIRPRKGNNATRYILHLDALLDASESPVQMNVSFSHLEKTCIPSFIGRNINLTTSPFLGVTSKPVYTIDCEIFTRSLHAMSLLHLGKSREALTELGHLDKMCCLQEPDNNEKRSVAYYNIVGNCYLTAKNKAKAIECFTKSVSLIPSPGNPARFVLLSLNGFNRKNLVQTGIIVAVGVAMIAFAYSALKLR